MSGFNILLRGAVAFYIASLLYLTLIIRANKQITKEADKIAAESEGGVISEEEKSRLLLKARQMIMKPLKTMIFLFVAGTILGIIGLFMR